MNQLILTIEGSDAERDELTSHLRGAGFEVSGCATGREGLQRAFESSPELIVIGLLLDMDPLELYRELRARPETAQVLILQLSEGDGSNTENAQCGADAFLTKPVDGPVLLATARSLIRLHRAEELVRDTAMEWTSTFEAIQDGVALLNLDGKVRRSNQRYRAITKSNTVRCEPMMPRLRATKRRQSTEQVSGGTTLLIHVDPLLNGEGALRGGVCTVADITERKKFEERLQHAQKLESIGVLAGGIAHDFNNLLTGILGNASLLLDELPSHSAGAEMAQEIVKASESAADLTRQLLAYAGKGRFVMQHLNLSEQISNSKAFLGRVVPHGVSVEFNLAPDLPVLEADASQLQQIVMNLTINAAESYGERGKGKVIVSTSRAQVPPGHPEMAPGTYALLTVSDTGCGMTREVKARIFDPFFTTKFTGRGLGLSAVHGILRAHHGHLELETEPGKGTTFKLYLPAAVNAEAAAEQTTDSALNTGDGLVLVIDDEVTVRTFAESALTRMGYRVLLAEDGRAGLDLVQRELGGLKAVLLDFAMPVMDGEEALERIREIAPDLPVILSTGFNVNAELDRLTRKGASAFLPKPFTASQLSNTLFRL